MTEKFEVRVRPGTLQRVRELASFMGKNRSGKDFGNFKRDIVEGAILNLEQLFVDRDK